MTKSNCGRPMHTVTVRKGSRLHRLLTRELVVTADRTRAERSRFCWGAEHRATALFNASGTKIVTDHSTVFILRPLGILHGLFGLTMEVS